MHPHEVEVMKIKRYDISTFGSYHNTEQIKPTDIIYLFFVLPPPG
jgi:hypothetical protein